jgi:hypothetical protein
MKINSRREVGTVLKSITNEGDFPESLEINTHNGIVTLEKIGNGQVSGNGSIFYMSHGIENIIVYYSGSGNNIKVLDISYKDTDN